jgi:hypothetical protein
MSNEMPIEELKRRLMSRHGYEEDELDATFKTEEELRKFYSEVVLKAGTITDEADDEGEWSDDDYELSATETEELEDLRRRKALRKERLERERKTINEQIDKAKFNISKNMGKTPSDESESDGDLGDETAKGRKVEELTYEDFLKSIKEGYEGDDTAVPNN